MTWVFRRQADMDDARFLFDLANEPSVRAMSFSTDPIPWDTHVAWLEKVLADPGRRLWVYESPDGEPVGMVRLDVRDGYEVVSIAVASQHRGNGYAGNMIRGLDARLPLLAEIKPENTTSIALFEQSGFTPDGPGRWVKE